MSGQAAADLKGSIRLGNYLRRLRTGYGYSLRRVEERAKAEGGEIDNSQLSRYEKGICYPSFDKLRVLASVFNVSIQAFSDVVDLEAFEGLAPQGTDAATLIDEGHEGIRRGDPGRAFACYESALDLLAEAPAGPERDGLVGKARVSLATALARLGKLSLAEQELRTALRLAIDPGLRAQALLNLANVHADQGDLVLAELEAERAHSLAQTACLDAVAGWALHTLGHVLAQKGDHGPAVEVYQQAIRHYQQAAEPYEAIKVRINVAGCFVAMGKSREAIRLLRAALLEARAGGHRRLEAHAWSVLGEASYRQGDHDRAMRSLRESDALAGGGEVRYPDILFVNAFYEWRMACADGSPTREKIAFGRLKTLRSALERRCPEVDTFDAYVERGRCDA